MPTSEIDIIASSEEQENPQGMSSYQSAPNPRLHKQFLKNVQEILLEYAFKSTSRHEKVVNYVDPEDLSELVDLEVGKSPESHEGLLDLIRDTLKYSVATGHPYFVNQLFSGLDPYGLAGQWLTDTLNPSVYTFEVAPLLTLMEESVLSQMRAIVGWDDGDGIFCPGGSLANGYAVNCARFHKFPQVKTKGLYGLPRMVMFTSEDAHYSVKKMAALQGLGSDNVLLVRTDKRGKMDVRHLEELVNRTICDGAIPFLVSATSGTTVLGAYDPLGPLSDICEKYGMWLHVDAAWGGGALMSKKHRHLLSSIERADSVTWNPHKMLAAPQQCSTFLTKHKTVLGEAHSAKAQYLFQKDKFYDTTYDTGDKHIQCGRRADVLKFWLMWKAKGQDGFERHVDRLYENAYYFTESLKNRPGFELVLQEPECTNVTFWFIPPSLRSMSRDDPQFNLRLNKVAPLIKERMMREGTMMITYQPQKGLPNFFRLVLQNSSLDKTDMDTIINEIERLGSDL